MIQLHRTYAKSSLELWICELYVPLIKIFSLRCSSPDTRMYIMVAIDTSRAAAPAIAHRIISAIYNIAASFTVWNEARMTRAALSRLSARELEDIGLCRGDIEEIATRGARF
jgi:uncharacterized protein YjiS (DUF1127 family)